MGRRPPRLESRSIRKSKVGEAKRRRDELAGLIWHHTSILRTNLIWMSGVIELEGRSKGAVHPAFGPIMTDATFRRPMRDFPALAWFTADINVPKCLQVFEAYCTDKATGLPRKLDLSGQMAATFSMNRMAIGFPVTTPGLAPWPQHYGYHTAEGHDLNASARDVGDDPDRWWVSEAPVDVLRSTDIRGAKSVFSLKLERLENYLAEVHGMVRLCRELPGTVIPPTWVNSDIHKALMAAGKDYRGPELANLPLQQLRRRD